MNSMWAGRALDVEMLLLVSLLATTGCSKQPLVSTDTVLTLATLGKGCGTEIHGVPVDFADTAIAQSPPVSHHDVCAIALSAAEGWELSNRQTQSDLCDGVKEQVFARFGVNNWSDAVRTAEALPADTAPNWPQAVAQLHACADDPEIGLKMLAQAIRMRLYSVGAASYNGSQCLAYLIELRPSDAGKGSGRIYELHGSASCPNLSLKQNPGNSPPGDVMVSKYRYAGVLPTDFEFHGVTHPFLSRSLGVAAGAPSIPVTTAVAATPMPAGTAAAVPESTSNGGSGCSNLSRHEPHSLDGKLVSAIFPGEPGFADVRRGDAPEAGYVLQLKNSICIRSNDEKGSADPTRRISEVQLAPTVGDEKTAAAMRSLNGVSVHVDLSAAQAEATGHDHRPLVGWVSSIIPIAPGIGPTVVSRPLVPASHPGNLTAENGTPATTVRGFYYALGQGNGADASGFVIPEKRESGAYSAENISRFYGPLPEPLVLVSLEPQGSSKYLASYRFRMSNRSCQGRSIVTVTTRDGLNLIEKIQSLDGC